MDVRVSLPRDTVLDGSYSIERTLGSGGFGITYEARDINLHTRVAIKEYYPGDFGQRDATMSVRPKSDNHLQTFEWGRSSFLREAQTLARFRHPNIVRVNRVFEDLATAYMVMDFEQGEAFDRWLANLGRPPEQQELDRIGASLLDALGTMHDANFIHRDIAPDNILIRPDGTPVLLDFGAARRAVAERSRTLTGIIKTGYSPQEQYATDGRLQGPWTDIYAFGATLYRAVTGKAPEEATLRGMDDRLTPASVGAVGKYRPDFLKGIDLCLKVRPSDRPQSVPELKHALFGTPLPARARDSAPKTQLAPPRESTGRPVKAWGAAIALFGIVVLGAGVAGGLYYSHREADERAAIAAGVDPVKAQAEEEARRRAEVQRQEAEEAARRAEAQRQADAEAARKKAEEDARLRAQAEADAKRKAEEEAKRVAAWEALKETTSIPELEAFIALYSGTQQASLAEGRIKKLKEELVQQIASKIDAAKTTKELEAIKAAYPAQLGSIAKDSQDPVQLRFLAALLRLQVAEKAAATPAKAEPPPEVKANVNRVLPAPPANLSQYSLNFWPKNSLDYKGQTVSTQTPHGRLTCTSNGRNTPRTCTLR